jgi:hypothetical protein
MTILEFCLLRFSSGSKVRIKSRSGLEEITMVYLTGCFGETKAIEMYNYVQKIFRKLTPAICGS